MSQIFDHIAALHGERRWGHLLDAGTGVNSLRWVRTLPTDRVTAVTGAASMAARIEDALGPAPEGEELVVGNWQEPAFLEGRSFDVVLADYLIGAIDGFAPYFQEGMIRRLRSLCSGRLYFVGLQPYIIDRPASAAGELIWRIGRLRDTVLLLCGQKPYREFPVEWVREQLTAAGFEVVDERRFPIRYRPRFVNAQLDMCVARLHLIEDPALRKALGTHVEALRREALETEARQGGLPHGFDYVLAAEPR